MGLIIQCSDPKTNIEEIVSEIKDYRKKREAASSKKKFDDEFINRKAQEIGLGDQTIAADYPDTTFRYLKATGIIDGDVYYRNIIIDSGGILKSQMVQNMSKMNNLVELNKKLRKLQLQLGILRIVYLI